MFNIDELENIFPLEIPDHLILTESVDTESLEDTERLRGKRWNQVETLLIYPLPCWLSPRAFHYYFPAFVKASYTDYQKHHLCIESVLHLLEYAESPAYLEWKRPGWLLFSDAQWQFMRHWLVWLESERKDDPDLRNRLGTMLEFWDYQRSC